MVVKPGMAEAVIVAARARRRVGVVKCMVGWWLVVWLEMMV